MPEIKQPKNQHFGGKQNGVRLVWSSTFAQDRSESLDAAQKFVDSECIRKMKRYTPARNLILSKAAVLSTKIGSGRIVFANPYARFQYYGKVMVSSVTGSPYARKGESKVLTNRDLKYSKLRHPEAQHHWFETMKTQYGEAILRGAARLAGGKPK